MSIMDNEGHNPQGLGNQRRAGVVDLERIRMMRMQLDQLAAELLARAANLHALAEQMEAREREIEMRENDVLKAWEEVKVQKIRKKMTA